MATADPYKLNRHFKIFLNEARKRNDLVAIRRILNDALVCSPHLKSTMMPYKFSRWLLRYACRDSNTCDLLVFVLDNTMGLLLPPDPLGFVVQRDGEYVSRVVQLLLDHGDYPNPALFRTKRADLYVQILKSPRGLDGYRAWSMGCAHPIHPYLNANPDHAHDPGLGLIIETLPRALRLSLLKCMMAEPRFKAAVWRVLSYDIELTYDTILRDQYPHLMSLAYGHMKDITLVQYFIDRLDDTPNTYALLTERLKPPKRIQSADEDVLQCQLTHVLIAKFGIGWVINLDFIEKAVCDWPKTVYVPRRSYELLTHACFTNNIEMFICLINAAYVRRPWTPETTYALVWMIMRSWFNTTWQTRGTGLLEVLLELYYGTWNHLGVCIESPALPSANVSTYVAPLWPVTESNMTNHTNDASLRMLHDYHLIVYDLTGGIHPTWETRTIVIGIWLGIYERSHIEKLVPDLFASIFSYLVGYNVPRWRCMELIKIERDNINDWNDTWQRPSFRANA